MFSFRRFFALMKRDLMMNKFSLLGVIVIYIGLTALLMICYNITMPNDSTITDVFSSFYLFFLISCSVLACVIPFKSYDKKYNRSESILLPASIEEKFVVNFVIAFIIVPVISFGAIFIGMEIGHLVNWIRFREYVLLYEETLYHFTESGHWITVFLAISFSFLGAVVFKKNKLIKTWAIVFALNVLLIIGLSVWVYLNADTIEKVYKTFLLGSILFTLFEIALYLICAACVVGAYLKLRRERS